MTTPADDVRAFAPIIGRWKTSGTVFDEQGTVVQRITGTDEYEWMVGGHWMVHRIDVMMGDQRSQGIEFIGDRDPGSGRYQMRAFDAGGSFSTMTIRQQTDGSWLLETAGARSTFVPPGDGGFMLAHWEREREDQPGTWIPWMEVRLEPLD